MAKDKQSEKSTQDKKRHHVVPVTYLKGFTDSQGRLFAYRKDAPDDPLHVDPANIGFRKYYYSQPLPNGEWDHNTLEDFFSKTVESDWRKIIEVIIAQKTLSRPMAEVLYNFIAALRVRVPAARDAAEFMLAEEVKATAHQLDEMGLLPPKPEGFENILDHLEVAIDPHQSIHAMAAMMRGFGIILDAVGFEIIKNNTDIPFITSDNPVIVFDPDVGTEELRPYELNPHQMSVELLFPIDSQHILRGNLKLKKLYDECGITYRNSNDLKTIESYNELIARFAYEIIFSSTTVHAELIKKHAELSPVPEASTLVRGDDRAIFFKYMFGKRRRKPKWIS